MKRVLTIAFLVLAMLLLAGCPPKAEPTVTGKAFVGGNRGLSLNFLAGAPPDSVFTGNPFSISLQLENVGEYTIENAADATVEITGINPPDFGTTKQNLIKDSPDPLQGASIDSAGNIVKGISTIVDFENLQYQKAISGTVPFPLIASVCYEYGTRAQSKICVLKDLIGRTTEARFCDPNNQNIPSESSGAPVQIVSMGENAIGSDKVAFTFKIRNAGTGRLHQQNTECATAIPAQDKVWVEIADTGLGELTCSGLKDGTAKTGYVTLFNNEATVRCTQVINNPADFVKVVDINLRYSYKESIQKTLQVKQAG